MKDFRKLDVRQKSYQLTLSLYKATVGFPSQELYGLTSQIRRAAVSIPANIAEGCGRGTSAELRQFLQVAMGSASELECHLLLARDLSLVNPDDSTKLIARVTEVKRMLVGLMHRLR